MPTILGNQSANALNGAGEPDLIYGRNGDDSIFGSGGDDRIYGERGIDLLNGGPGNDLIVQFGSSFNFLQNGYPGYDQVEGSITPRVESGVGGRGNDTILGGNASGGDGDDLLVNVGFNPTGQRFLLQNDTVIDQGSANGGPGNDTILGGGLGDDGADVFIVRHGARVEPNLTGFGTIDLHNDFDQDIIVVDGAIDGNIDIWSLYIGDIIYFRNVPGLLSYQDLMDRLSIEVVGAGEYGHYDGLVRRAVLPIDADTTLTVHGYFPNASFSWGVFNYDVEAVYRQIDQVLSLSSLREGTPQSDNILGSANIDVVLGDSGGDSISTLGGNDEITGGSGDDTVDGGEGNDTAIFAGNKADYTITRNANGSYAITDTTAGRDGTDTLSNIEQARFADQTFALNTDLPFPALFAANLSQAKAISAAYQILLGGVPGQAGYEFLIKGNLSTNFGAGAGPVFNDENIFINVANALVQGNATATAKFNALAAGNTLAEKITSLYKAIIPTAKQSADGIAFITRPDGLKFYQDVARERGITAENGPAVTAMASLLKIAVDGKNGIGNPVSDLIASIADGSSELPTSSQFVLPIETIDGTKFDADDAPDAMPGFFVLPPAPIIGVVEPQSEPGGY